MGHTLEDTLLPDPTANGKKYRERLRNTIILLNTATFIQAISETILPSVFKELAHDLNVVPSQLGLAQTARILTQASFSLLAAYLVLRGVNRPRIIGFGTVICSIMTAGVGLAYNYPWLVLCRSVDGFGLAIVVPAVQAMVADAHLEKDRGFAFGAMAISYGLGNLCGNIFATTMAATTVQSMPGWRFAFLVLAAVGSLVGTAVHLFAIDPDPARAEGLHPDGVLPLSIPADDNPKVLSHYEEFQGLLENVLTVLRIDTFKAIIVQGIVGSCAWTSMSFLTMYLELAGFSHVQAAFLMAAFVLAVSVGALFGGFIGDVAARVLPDSGRIMVAQFSAFSIAPLFFVVLRVLPSDPSYFYAFALALGVGGMFISWSATGANSPIFSEIVPAGIRTTVFAADHMLESLLAAFGPWAVGFVAEKVFGYDVTGHGGKKDAHALGYALLWNTAVPALLCCLIYSWMYWTYPRDKRKAMAVELN